MDHAPMTIEEYERRIPPWCSLRTAQEHVEEMLGCWSVTAGFAEREGNCKGCEFYAPQGVTRMESEKKLLELARDLARAKRDLAEKEKHLDWSRDYALRRWQEANAEDIHEHGQLQTVVAELERQLIETAQALEAQERR